MKIANEVEGVQVLRCETVGESLSLGLIDHTHGGFAKGVIDTLRLNKKFAGNNSVEELLGRNLLRKPYEDSDSYKQTLALCLLERDLMLPEIYAELALFGYYPGSLSEGMSFFRAMPRIEPGSVIHLATRILDDDFTERRIVTYGRDGAGLIKIYPSSKIKSHHQLVVVKNKVQKKK